MKKNIQNSANGIRLWPVILLFFLTNTFFLLFFYVTLAPPGRTESIEINVPSGSSLSDISTLLEEKGVIKSRLAFHVMTKLRGLSTGLRAGKYVIPPGTTPWNLISLLTTGQGDLFRFTVPEGLSDKQVVERVTAVLKGLDAEKMLSLSRNSSFADELSLEAPGLIGYMFPDTYFVPPTLDESEVLRLMVGRFFEVYNQLAGSKKQPNGLKDRHQNVILASIIEKEAVLDKERPLISSVFLNRLELNRPLESCATVLFVLGKHKSRLLYKDLEVKSPYNTYLHRGLPPGPICNPGKASLQAALYPSETKYLYFVARGDGSHEFSRSLNEHINAKRRFRRSGPGSG